VDVSGSIMERVDEDCADADLLGGLHSSSDGVTQRTLAQYAALVLAVDREAGQLRRSSTHVSPIRI